MLSLFETSTETEKQSFNSSQLVGMVGYHFSHFSQNGQNLHQNSQNSVSAGRRGVGEGGYKLTNAIISTTFGVQI